jgi:hypothetical protein
VLAEIIEQGGEGRELAADAGGGELALLEVLALGDDVGAGDGAQLGDVAQAGEGNELLNVDLIGAAGFGVGEVGKPFELGRDLDAVVELGGGEGRRSAGAVALLTRTRSCFILLPCPAVLNMITCCPARSPWPQDDLAQLHQRDGGFTGLAEATKIPPKSLMRMFSAVGNPRAANLFEIVSFLQHR